VGENGGMDENPYKSPVDTASKTSSEAGWIRRRRMALWGYPVAMVVGAFIGVFFLLPQTAEWDDSGGKQLLVGAFISFVIYHFLF
jgi:hypothetical protein